MAGTLKKLRFQSAPPVKGATSEACSAISAFRVSIRAPREGGDACQSIGREGTFGFNPRPP